MPASSEDLREIKKSIKKIEELLVARDLDYTVSITKLDQEIALHRKMWGGLIGIVTAIGVFFIQRHTVKGS